MQATGTASVGSFDDEDAPYSNRSRRGLLLHATAQILATKAQTHHTLSFTSKGQQREDQNPPWTEAVRDR